MCTLIILHVGGCVYSTAPYVHSGDPKTEVLFTCVVEKYLCLYLFRYVDERRGGFDSSEHQDECNRAFESRKYPQEFDANELTTLRTKTFLRLLQCNYPENDRIVMRNGMGKGTRDRGR